MEKRDLALPAFGKLDKMALIHNHNWNNVVRQRGFTIPELLIVIATIAILAAVVIVSYNGITNKANNAAVQSDLEAVRGLLESYRADPDTPDEFPHDTTALATLGIKATKKSYQTNLSTNFIYCVASDYKSYALAAASKSGEIFMINEKGFRDYTLGSGNFTSSGLCPAVGMGGGYFVTAGMTAPNTWASWVNDN